MEGATELAERVFDMPVRMSVPVSVKGMSDIVDNPVFSTGVGLIMLSMVFAQVGLPIEGIGLILGVDRLMDMIRTAVNISGDAVVTSIVANSEGKLDKTIFNDENAGTESIHLDEKVEQELADTIKKTHDTA